MLTEMSFRDPQFLYLLLLLPVMIFLHWRRRNKRASVRLSALPESMRQADPLAATRWLPFALRMLALAALIIAIARPQSSEMKTQRRSAEGIDIVVALDVSTSMEAMDFQPNRLEAAKEVALEFIEGRNDDRFGVVAYAGESYTSCPLTTDHRIVKRSLRDIEFGLIEDGTAIGMGLATAVNRLKDSKAKSKVIILMSDGVNNSGSVDPITAAGLAAEFNIRCYTIGVGTEGMAPVWVHYTNGERRKVNMEVNIDEELLEEIAGSTGGKYFRATDNEKLAQIYEEIDKLEKTKLEESHYYQYAELFYNWAWLAFALLALEFGLRMSIYRSIS